LLVLKDAAPAEPFTDLDLASVEPDSFAMLEGSHNRHEVLGGQGRVVDCKTNFDVLREGSQHLDGPSVDGLSMAKIGFNLDSQMHSRSAPQRKLRLLGSLSHAVPPLCLIYTSEYSNCESPTDFL